jgi:hypothetical protein
MKASRFGEACPKLEESQRLERATGTQFKLADCYEQTGKTASAWANFLEVAASARRAGQAEREGIAKARADALTPKLTKLLIQVGGEATPGLDVTRDGKPVGRGLWGTPVPVDPGIYVIRATAPGRDPWEKKADAQGAGWTVTVTVPALFPKGEGPAEPAPEGGVTRSPPAQGGEGLGTQRIVGISLAGAGVVGIGIGVAFGVIAMSKNDEALENCRTPELCTQKGLDLTASAEGAATASTIGFIAGTAALAGGAVLFFTAKKAAPAAARLRIGPGGASLSGRF